MAGIVQQKLLDANTSGYTLTLSLDAPVTPGNSILVLADWFSNVKDEICTLKAIWDNQSNSYALRTAGHRDPDSGYLFTGDLYASIWDCLSVNSTGTFTLAFYGDASATWTQATIRVLEVSGIASFAAAGTQSGGAENGSSVSVSSPTLTPVPQFVVAACAAAASNVQSPVTMTNLDLWQNDGVGVQAGGFAWKRVTTEGALAATWAYDPTLYGAAAVMAAYLESASGGTTGTRLKFTFDATLFTDADANIEGFVWVYGDGWPDFGSGIYVTSLSGDTTAGVLYVESGLPDDLVVGQQVKGLFYNSADNSGLISGVVVAGA